MYSGRKQRMADRAGIDAGGPRPAGTGWLLVIGKGCRKPRKWRIARFAE
jgi:hypothetical protein